MNVVDAVIVSVIDILTQLVLEHSHDARYVANRHRSVVGPALSLLVLAAVRLLTGRRVVRHLDGRPAGLLPLPQLPQLFGQSRQVLGDRKRQGHQSDLSCFTSEVVRGRSR